MSKSLQSIAKFDSEIEPEGVNNRIPLLFCWNPACVKGRFYVRVGNMVCLNLDDIDSEILKDLSAPYYLPYGMSTRVITEEAYDGFHVLTSIGAGVVPLRQIEVFPW